ncbi:MAG: hypothetical protein PHC64_07850 [Candidatus Gastranaerophilales bacterium]|nr:hypothetical protein [Candidatus Gastranaerophilales bacterium]
MLQKELNDYIVEVIQDYKETASMLKVLKDSVNNENKDIAFVDIGNTLEIILAKINNANLAFEKYIDIAF